MIEKLPLSISQHANKHSITPLKKHGQNFILDSSLCDKIVKASGLKKNNIVLEIGPGIGGLTRSILAYTPYSLTVIETDQRCIPLLEEIKNLYPNMVLIHGDALKFDLNSLAANEINIISNLPYQIGTELVIKWLKNADLIASMTLMLQKEVVDRMRAKPNNKIYGRLSVICQLICSVEKCFDVSPAAFYPPPKVYSSIVKLIPKKILPEAKVIERIEFITRIAFSERRKMIKSSLKKLSPELSHWLNLLNIDSSCRAENLSPQDYLALATLSMK